jgi:hypothetical protein
VTACHDCATCTARPELARSLGRSPEEVRRLSARCDACGHRLRRHLHGPTRSSLALTSAEVTLETDSPPRDSPLGQLLVELGEYDDYPDRLDT